MAVAEQEKQYIIMKRFKNLLMLALMVFAIVACSNEVDPRDEFVGVYSFTQTGSATLYSNGSALGSVPMNGEGTMYCNKVGTGNQVRLTGDIIEEVDGTVSGNTLILNPTTVVKSSDGITMQMTFTYKPAIKNGNTVTCVANINGIANGNNTNATISGSITLVAVKK